MVQILIGTDPRRQRLPLDNAGEDGIDLCLLRFKHKKSAKR